MRRQPIGRLGDSVAGGVADLGRDVLPPGRRAMMPLWRVGIRRRWQDLDTL